MFQKNSHRFFARRALPRGSAPLREASNEHGSEHVRDGTPRGGLSIERV